MSKLPCCEVLVVEYRTMSQIAIAQRYGVTRMAVSLAMKKCDIVVRGRSQALKQYYEKGDTNVRRLKRNDC